MNNYIISISWMVEDVLSLDSSLTFDDCVKVLDHAKETHDAGIGINWDTLQEAINYIKGE